MNDNNHNDDDNNVFNAIQLRLLNWNTITASSPPSSSSSSSSSYESVSNSVSTNNIIIPKWERHAKVFYETKIIMSNLDESSSLSSSKQTWRNDLYNQSQNDWCCQPNKSLFDIKDSSSTNIDNNQNNETNDQPASSLTTTRPTLSSSSSIQQGFEPTCIRLYLSSYELHTLYNELCNVSISSTNNSTSTSTTSDIIHAISSNIHSNNNNNTNTTTTTNETTTINRNNTIQTSGLASIPIG